MSGIEDVVSHYGGQLTNRGKLRCILPEHQDTSPSVSISTGKYHCFVCGVHEDAIGLIQKLEGCGYAEAREKAEEITGESLSEVSGSTPQSRTLFGETRNLPRNSGGVQDWRSRLSGARS